MSRQCRSVLLLAGLALMPLSVAAQTGSTGFTPFAFDIRDGDRVVVQVPRLRLTVGVTSDGSSGLRWSRRQVSSSGGGGQVPATLALQTRRTEQLVILELEPQREGASPGDPQGTEVNLELRLPSRVAGLMVHGRDISLTASGLPFGLQVYAADLSGLVKGGSAGLAVRTQKADLRIEGNRGGTDIEALNGRISVQGGEGAAVIATRSAEVSIAGLKGSLNLRSFDGASVLRAVEGDVDYVIQRGSISGTEHLGDLRGRNEEGSSTWALKAPLGDIRIESEKGAISLQVPQASGAPVRVSTEGVQVQIPETIKLQAGAGSQGGRVYSGRLAGSASEGRVNLTTKEGPIRLR